MYLSEELVSVVGELAQKNINALIVVCRDVALAKDARLFLKVAACLFLIAIVGGLTDIASLCYICKFPSLYFVFANFELLCSPIWRSLSFCVTIWIIYYVLTSSI